MMDYRKLLKLYIYHVGECEGVTFVSDGYREPGIFTDEEWEALKELEGESIDGDF